MFLIVSNLRCNQRGLINRYCCGRCIIFISSIFISPLYKSDARYFWQHWLQRAPLCRYILFSLFHSSLCSESNAIKRDWTIQSKSCIVRQSSLIALVCFSFCKVNTRNPIETHDIKSWYNQVGSYKKKKSWINRNSWYKLNSQITSNLVLFMIVWR